MKQIALGEDEDLLESRHSSIVLNYSSLIRPRGQRFEVLDDEMLEYHSELRMTKSGDKTARLDLQVKNYGAYFYKKQEMSGTLFPDLKAQELKQALQGTEEDWEWAKKKFSEILNQAESLGRKPRKKSNVIPGIIKYNRGNDGTNS